MNRKYEILNWCFLPQTHFCDLPTMTITIRPDDYLTPDLQRGYHSGLTGTIRGTNSVHDNRVYQIIFDKVIFTENDYMGTIINNTPSIIPPQNGFIEFKLPNIPMNYFL